MPQDHLSEQLSLQQIKKVANAEGYLATTHVIVEQIQQKQTSNASPYLELRLQDLEEHFIWRIFDNHPAFHDLKNLRKGAGLELQALWTLKSKFGLEAQQVQWRYLTALEQQNLLQGPEQRRLQHSQDWLDIQHFIANLKDPRLRLLSENFIQQYGERFQRSAAAREYHHAYRGGLVEHVAQMMRSAHALAQIYPEIHADLLITGVLFHDSGKLWENHYTEQSLSMSYSIHGELLGHISLGLELINKLWRQLMETPEAQNWAQLTPASESIRLHLLHLIASHHGQLEYGSPVLPKTPEAMLLHYIDNIDAKHHMMQRSYDHGRMLAPQIYERVRPLTQALVSPLEKLQL